MKSRLITQTATGMKLVVYNSGRSWGGNEKWLATLAAGLQRRGHAVVVACGEGEVAVECAAGASRRRR